MGKLDDKIALITGGTSGIGEATSRLFAKEGAEVIVVGRNKERGNRIVSSIKTDGGKAHFLECDVNRKESVNTLKSEFVKYYNRLDILVNNAGIMLTSKLEEIDEADWMGVFNTNMHSTMRVTKCFMDLILIAKGTILNNASNAGLAYWNKGKSNYAYAASKAAVIKFTKQLALNYTPYGVRVNCLCPGVTETPLFTNRDFSRFNSSIPLGRVAQTDEIAKAALFLVSEDASYISGAVLPVDGAASLM